MNLRELQLMNPMFWEKLWKLLKKLKIRARIKKEYVYLPGGRVVPELVGGGVVVAITIGVVEVD